MRITPEVQGTRQCTGLRRSYVTDSSAKDYRSPHVQLSAVLTKATARCDSDYQNYRSKYIGTAMNPYGSLCSTHVTKIQYIVTNKIPLLQVLCTVTPRTLYNRTTPCPIALSLIS
jgi:hypothetical protein